MNSKLENIFSDNVCLSPEELMAYASNQLSSKALHRAERHLLSCELCADAVEGIRAQADEKKFRTQTEALNRSIGLRTKQKSKATGSSLNFQKIAAVVTLLLIAGGTWYYISTLNSNEKLYSQHFEPYQKPTDSAAITSQPPATAPLKKLNETPAEKPSAKKQNSKTPESLVVQEEKRVEQIPSEDIVVDNVKDETGTASDLSATSTQGVAAPVKQEESLDRAATESREVAVTEIALEKKSGKKAKALNTAPTTAGQTVESNTAMLKVSSMSMPPEIVTQYDSGQYEMSFKGAEQFLKKNPENAEALFYSGISALSLKKEKTAAQRLEACIKTGSSVWTDEASWYLALTKIRQDKTTEARSLLEKITAGNSPRKAEAASLLDELRGK